MSRLLAWLSEFGVRPSRCSRLDHAATSQRDRQQSPDRADRSVSGMRPALTGPAWKKASRPVQGWGAVHLMSKTYLKSDHFLWGRPTRLARVWQTSPRIHRIMY